MDGHGQAHLYEVQEASHFHRVVQGPLQFLRARGGREVCQARELQPWLEAVGARRLCKRRVPWDATRSLTADAEGVLLDTADHALTTMEWHCCRACTAWEITAAPCAGRTCDGKLTASVPAWAPGAAGLTSALEAASWDSLSMLVARFRRAEATATVCSAADMLPNGAQRCAPMRCTGGRRAPAARCAGQGRGSHCLWAFRSSCAAASWRGRGEPTKACTDCRTCWCASRRRRGRRKSSLLTRARTMTGAECRYFESMCEPCEGTSVWRPSEPVAGGWSKGAAQSMHCVDFRSPTIPHHSADRKPKNPLQALTRRGLQLFSLPPIGHYASFRSRLCGGCRHTAAACACWAQGSCQSSSSEGLCSACSAPARC